MIISFNHAHPWIFVGVLTALAACPQDKTPGTTDDPQNEDTASDPSTSSTTSDPSTSTTTVAPTSSGPSSTTTSDTTEPSEPGTTSTSSNSTSSTSTSSTSTSDASTTTLDPDTTTGGDLCPLDLTLSLELGFDLCDDELTLIVTVHNVGTVDEAPAGIDVTFFEGTDASGIKLGTKPTTEPLPPGSSTDLTWTLPAPSKDEPRDYYVEVDSGPNGGSIVECDENNNSVLVTDAACPG